MRIGLTRLAAARKFFSSMVTDGEWTAIEGEIAWLDGILGYARDDDVMQVYVRREGDEAFSDMDRRMILRDVSSGHAHVEQALGSKRYKVLFGKIQTWIEHGPWTTTLAKGLDELRRTSLELFALRRLERWSRRLARSKRCPIDSNRQHRLRIRAKRYRYMVEALSELSIEIPHRRLREAEAARRLQQALGDIRDLRRIRRKIGSSGNGAFRALEEDLLRQASKAFNRLS